MQGRILVPLNLQIPSSEANYPHGVRPNRSPVELPEGKIVTLLEGSGSPEEGIYILER